MNDLIYQLVMGSYLHDIGKIGQRGDIPQSPDTENMAQHICRRTPEGYFTHRHVLWTNQFLDVWQSHLADLAGDDVSTWIKIKDIASNHHCEVTEPLEATIQEADCLASGHDRPVSEPDDRERPGRRKDAYKYVPLLSIFSQVDIGRPKPEMTGIWTIPDYGNPADDPLVQFPRLVKEAGRDEDYLLTDTEGGPTRYRTIWTWMEKTLGRWAEQYRGMSRWDFCAALDALGQLGWSYVPASTLPGQNDVSLYDHARLVAALSAAMGRYHQGTDTLNAKAIKDRSISKFRFVVGTLSGIQDYIFRRSTEVRAGAARRYRARSFLLSLMTQVVSSRILHRLGLPVFNRIIDAGGRFTLLADNTPETLALIEDELTAIATALNQEYCGLVRLHVDTGTVAAGQDFVQGRFADIYESLQHRIDLTKHQDQGRYLQDGDSWAEDHFVHRPVIERYGNLKQWEQADAEQAAKIGSRLPRSKYLFLYSGPQTNQPLIRCLGLNGDLSAEPVADLLRSSGDALALKLALAPDVHHLPPVGIFPALGKVPIWTADLEPFWQFLHANAKTDDEIFEENSLISFQEMAHLSCDNDQGKLKGIGMLGCLKADVDRLGRIFAAGFGKQVSIGRIVTLSRQMDAFFKFHLWTDAGESQKRPAKSRQMDAFFKFHLPRPLSHHHYVVFAGGDDLFLVGTWDTLLFTLRDIYREFHEYVCRNANITFSAGIVFGRPKAPIYQLTVAAEEALEAAKGHAAAGDGRDRVHLLDRNFAWGQYATALDQAQELWKVSGKLSRAFLYRLHVFEKMAHEVTEQVKKHAGPIHTQKLLWRSRLRYDLGRNLEKHRELCDLVLSLTANEGMAEMGMPPNVRLATTYVLYKSRSLMEVSND